MALGGIFANVLFGRQGHMGMIHINATFQHESSNEIFFTNLLFNKNTL